MARSRRPRKSDSTTAREASDPSSRPPGRYTSTRYAARPGDASYARTAPSAAATSCPSASSAILAPGGALVAARIATGPAAGSSSPGPAVRPPLVAVNVSRPVRPAPQSTSTRGRCGSPVTSAVASTVRVAGQPQRRQRDRRTCGSWLRNPAPQMRVRSPMFGRLGCDRPKFACASARPAPRTRRCRVSCVPLAQDGDGPVEQRGQRLRRGGRDT